MTDRVYSLEQERIRKQAEEMFTGIKLPKRENFDVELRHAESMTFDDFFIVPNPVPAESWGDGRPDFVGVLKGERGLIPLPEVLGFMPDMIWHCFMQAMERDYREAATCSLCAITGAWPIFDDLLAVCPLYINGDFTDDEEHSGDKVNDVLAAWLESEGA